VAFGARVLDGLFTVPRSSAIHLVVLGLTATQATHAERSNIWCCQRNRRSAARGNARSRKLASSLKLARRVGSRITAADRNLDWASAPSHWACWCSSHSDFDEGCRAHVSEAISMQYERYHERRKRVALKLYGTSDRLVVAPAVPASWQKTSRLK